MIGHNSSDMLYRIHPLVIFLGGLGRRSRLIWDLVCEDLGFFWIFKCLSCWHGFYTFEKESGDRVRNYMYFFLIFKTALTLSSVLY